MTYRAAPVTQRDGSPLASSNCLMATAAVGLDYETRGAKTSTGSKMRNYSGDTAGGTNTDEIEKAWKNGYNEDPITRDGHPFDDVLADLYDKRLVMLQVWHATVGGPCLSGSGAYGHGIAVAPEKRVNTHTEWLVADPWCNPPKWAWVREDKLRAGAEEWVRHSASGATGGHTSDPRGIPLARLIRAARDLMTSYYPGHPEPYPQEYGPVGAGGPVGVLFASTHPVSGSDDVAINTNGSRIQTVRYVDLTDDAGFYKEAELDTKYGVLSAGRKCALLGPALGTNSYAILVNTSAPYDDHEDRDTVVYVTKDKCGPVYQDETPPIDMDARDSEWRDWLNTDPHSPDKG